jgi:ABC-2 type transport system permease protein
VSVARLPTTTPYVHGGGRVAARILFVGGLMSYRALFGWLSPYIFVPSMMIAPLFQILLFTYIGRAASLESDEFYVIGNALQYGAIPCLFAMAAAIAGERWQQTLPMILATPAPRLPLFVGRALPVIANGFFVALFGLAAGGLILGIDVPAGSVPAIVLATAVSAYSCTGLGLVNAALGLRVRETAVLGNIIFGILLVFCGVNIPLDELPGWMSATAQVLPLTHSIEAARELADGVPLADVAGLLGIELLVGTAWAVVGYVLLRVFEFEARRRATLESA